MSESEADELIVRAIEQAEWEQQDLIYKAPEYVASMGQREYQAALPWILLVLQRGLLTADVRPVAIAMARQIVGAA